ncbi:hypothetical protein PYR71_16200 [Rhizobium sp. MC63]|uniref:Uncharacterized protein n=1 Tax=Rhizobium mulingense TaxID=3031128 RepID=A0ACC6MXN9_9HYPH|nr:MULTISPECIES: hypothetical protein [unclassified Rhizobium]MDF0698014.1 hypothetical protein [Rhizobium sp. MC63]MEA3518119.1 hypothetical protein [Rhizobium sp. MJ31]MEB3043577.1 hypothetical protein [Rhizobium sp. MJ21]
MIRNQQVESGPIETTDAAISRIVFSCDCGYAEMMMARNTGLVAMTDKLTKEETAPILCGSGDL